MDRDYLGNGLACAPPGVFIVQKRGMGLPDGYILYYMPIMEVSQKNIARTDGSVHHFIAPPYRDAVGLDPSRCRLNERPARIMKMEKEKAIEPLNPPFMKHLASQDVPACREADSICRKIMP